MLKLEEFQRIGGVYRGSFFVRKGSSKTTSVSSLAHPCLPADVWTPELLKRAPSQQLPWGNLGYEGERVFAREEVCTDNTGAGILLATARSKVV